MNVELKVIKNQRLAVDYTKSAIEVEQYNIILKFEE